MSSAQSDEKKTMMGNAFSKASQIMTGVGKFCRLRLKCDWFLTACIWN